MSKGNLSDHAVTGAPSQRFLTTSEVAEKCRAPVETVRYWRHIGRGPRSFKLGRRVLYAVEDVEAFIAEARAAEPQEAS